MQQAQEPVTVTKNHEKPIAKAAKFIGSEIEEYCHKTVQNSFNSPPRIEELILHKKLPPSSVLLFLTNLLKFSRRARFNNLQKLA